MNWWLPLSLGFLGSLHCVGMCGPIALALPFNNKNGFNRISGGLVYSFGRITTYAFIGLLFGTFGKGLSLVGLHQWISILVGTIMVLSVIFSSNQFHGFKLSRYIIKATNVLRSFMFKYLRKEGTFALYIFGILNGALPCGLVYMAVLGSMASANPLHGALFMMLFGLANSPALLAIVWAKGLLKSEYLTRIRRAIPAFVVIMGLIFVIRGLGLGIPYLSPKAEALLPVSEAKSCH